VVFYVEQFLHQFTKKNRKENKRRENFALVTDVLWTHAFIRKVGIFRRPD